MTASIMSTILEIDQLVGSIERLQRQQIDTSDPYRKGFRDGRNELAGYTTRALARIRTELMSFYLDESNAAGIRTKRNQA